MPLYGGRLRADNRGMRRRLLSAILLVALGQSASAYRLIYREQLYELYHRHFYDYPERIAENVYWLERTLDADFANPLNALAVVENDREWEWYRALFSMHVNIKLAELYLRWGAQYFKWNAYFYNAPWQQENLRSLERADILFRSARPYWEEAQRWSQEVAGHTFIHLEEIQAWEDEHARIRTGSLDYGAIIDRHLERLEAVRGTFEAMDASTY